VSNQPSAFVWLRFEDILGRMLDGTPVAQEPALAGRVVIVGEEPLLEAVMGTNGQPALLLYSKSGSTNWLDATTRLEPAPSWVLYQQVVMPKDALLQVIQPVCTNGCTIFIRARRAL
jgi:hypothetical protein